ncbi:RNA polymerase sigma factor [Reichenbachiella versicolor]|uniref:RNA polymerase sigma factor n=1 Tax=Reichenbachiella versicolor TaxID=1821036 RepID=UPI000D6DF1D9|nr:RNA polymerase sigma factor [Reichenbachiella versicolor]
MEEQILIKKAVSGDRDALDSLIKKYQNWVYNTAIIFVGDKDEAQDITQEVLIKMISNLGTFNEKSQFKTWLYRIIKNHFLNMKRGKYEQSTLNFEAFGKALDSTPDEQFSGTSEAEEKLVLREAKISCMNGMLLCLDREQRLIFLMGEIFEFADIAGAEVMEISRENFRVKLHRAKKQLYTFMDGKCGLINKSNPCRCARKTSGFIKAGYVDPNTLQFQKDKISSIREQLSNKIDALHHSINQEYKALFQNNPFLDSPETSATIKRLLDSTSVRETFNL